MDPPCGLLSPEPSVLTWLLASCLRLFVFMVRLLFVWSCVLRHPSPSLRAASASAITTGKRSDAPPAFGGVARSL